MAHICSSAGGVSGEANRFIHSATDLLWTDGLDALRYLCEAAHRPGTVLGPSVTLRSSADLAWYARWKGLPEDHAFEALPKIEVSKLLEQLDVPVSEQQIVIQKLKQEDVRLLQQLVLPDFLDNAVQIIDSQLPGLDVEQLYRQHKLFAGYAWFHCTPWALWSAFCAFWHPQHTDEGCTYAILCSTYLDSITCQQHVKVMCSTQEGSTLQTRKTNPVDICSFSRICS